MEKGWGDVTGGGTVEWPNIFFCQGLGKDAATAKGTLQQKQFYITAEVGRKKMSILMLTNGIRSHF